MSLRDYCEWSRSLSNLYDTLTFFATIGRSTVVLSWQVWILNAFGSADAYRDFIATRLPPCSRAARKMRLAKGPCSPRSMSIGTKPGFLPRSRPHFFTRFHLSTTSSIPMPSFVSYIRFHLPTFLSYPFRRHMLLGLVSRSVLACRVSRLGAS